MSDKNLNINDNQTFTQSSNILKNNEEDHTLLTTESGTITLRKYNWSQKFTDIAEWLLAFKSYMKAILVIYNIREQELNTYRDYISTLCIKQEFVVVINYDENRHIHLTMNMTQHCSTET
ncbi:1999_t:CDS:2 [Dentiscutata erythropus]|uniref:1999_t:CDS:1 n=1 Tax=Dentiscutata erythropus TaxID=1348616 RepID=A0A9N9DPZ8_9GLOM|nr:1999_t:CDS:2 [Dentiscutata erythropus]